MSMLRNLTTLGFFLVLCSLLFLNRKKTHAFKFDELIPSLELNTSNIKAEISEWDTAARKELAQPYQRENTKDYTRKLEIVANTAAKVDAHLERLKNWSDSLIAAKFLKERLYTACKRNGIDTLCNMLDNYKALLLDQLVPYHRNMNLYRQEYVSRLNRNHLSDKTLWRNLNSAEELKSVLCVVQSEALFIRLFTTIELTREILPMCGMQFTSFMAVTVPYNSFALEGQKVTASAGVFVYDNTLNPIVKVDKGITKKTEYGFVTWTRKKSPLGLNKVSGHILAEVNTNTISRPFSFQYFVAAKGINLQLDKANSCYIGIENIISVAVPGYPLEKLSLKIEGAEVGNLSPGRFSIYFRKMPAKDVYAFVYGTNAEGNTSAVASFKLRIKQLPDPVFTIQGEDDDYIRMRDLKRALGPEVIRKHPDFDMSYDVLSYKLSLLQWDNGIYIEPVKGTGNYFSGNAAVEKMLELAQKGDRLIFEDILVKDELGRTISLPPASLKIY